MSQNILKKNPQPELDETTASQMLENIFNACEVEPNSVPLSVLTSYSNYRQARYRLQKILLIIIIILFCLMPFLFLTPKLQIKQKNGSDSIHGKASYLLNVDSFIPVSHITAEIDGRNISVYETADNLYTIEPSQNGKMTIVVTLKNRQYSTITYDIIGVDTESPVLLSNESRDNQIFLYLSDTGSGVDYESIYALDLNGNTLEPVSYDEEKNYAVFPYPDGSLNIYIPDKSGNTLQLVLTIRSN